MFLLDTNILIGLLRKKEPFLSKYRKTFSNQENKQFISSFTIVELYDGVFNNPNEQKRNEEQKIIDIFLDNIKRNQLILYFTENEAYMYSKLQKQLKDIGNPIPIFDLLIASIAFNNNLILLTTDREHFSKIEEINSEFKVKYW